MGKIYLGLRWINHVKVANKGGTFRIRDEEYSELVEKADLLTRILSRVRRTHGNESLVVNTEFEEYHKLCKHILKTGKMGKRTVMHGTRPLVTYEIVPLKIQFDISGATYVIDYNGKVRHVAGERPYYQAASGVKVHHGLSESQAHAAGIKRVKHDHKQVMADIYKRAKEIEADKLRKSGLKGKALIDAMAKNAKARKEHLEKCKAQNGDDVPFEPPYTPIENKPQTGMDKGKGKPKQQQSKKANKKLDKPTPKADNKGKPSDSGKPSDKPNAKPNTSQTPSGLTFSKAQLTECEKWDVDPFNPPEQKPKGMKGRVWKQIVVANRNK